ncbi:hypothetical protein OG979_02175 [Actinomadura citrea]|uniref:hypothetical protein n=1 Tax=Actinomadura citrea TaxID=46158 RepID=UPI002E2DDD46|nr:hypothetical protein [Actinomadura citrea]
MRRITAISTAVLPPATLLTAPAFAASSPTAAARAAAADLPTYTPGLAGPPDGRAEVCVRDAADRPRTKTPDGDALPAVIEGPRGKGCTLTAFDALLP